MDSETINENKVTDILNKIETPSQNKFKSLTQDIKISETSQNETTNNSLSSKMPNVEVKKEDESEILQIVKPVIIRAQFESQRTDVNIHPELKSKYGNIVENAIQHNWITATEIQEGISKLTKQEKENKAKENIESVRNKIEEVKQQLREGKIEGEDLASLMALRNELNSIDTEKLDENIKTEINSTINEIEEMFKRIQDMKNKYEEDDNSVSMWGILEALFG